MKILVEIFCLRWKLFAVESDFVKKNIGSGRLKATGSSPLVLTHLRPYYSRLDSRKPDYSNLICRLLQGIQEAERLQCREPTTSAAAAAKSRGQINYDLYRIFDNRIIRYGPDEKNWQHMTRMLLNKTLFLLQCLRWRLEGRHFI